MSSESRRVFVTHVDDSPSGRQGPCLYFWGQKNRSVYLQLENYLNSLEPFFNSCSPPTNETGLNKQVLCAIIDKNWLRVKMIEPIIVDHLGLVEVFCIDSGMVKSIPLAFLRIIPSVPGSAMSELAFNLKDIEPLADKFVLADVMAIRGQWTESALMFLKENMENISWEAVSLGRFSGHTGVRLYNQNKSILFATTMIEKNLGLPTQTYQAALATILPSESVDLQPPDSSTSPLFENLSYSSKPVPFTVQSQFPSNQFPTPTSKNFPSSLVHPLGNFPHPEVQPYSVHRNHNRESDSRNRTVTCNPHISSKNPRAYVAAEIHPGVVNEVFVTYVQNGPRKFTIQLKEAQFGLDLLRKKIDSLQLEPMVGIHRGFPCIAVLSRDQQPHRGLITTVESDSCQVYFIDYGNFETLNKRFIFEIPDELVRIRLCACRVGLADIEELEQFDPNMVSDIFHDLVLGKHFQCELVGDELSQKVNLYDVKGVDVKQLLISVCRIQTANTTNASLMTRVEPTARPNRPKPNEVYPVRSASTRVTLKIPEPSVNREEKLFVTYVGTNGRFFGQLESRSLQELGLVLNELPEIYDVFEPDSHLLYSDVRSHCGDFAVIKWSVDSTYYRVRIEEELANDIIVQLVDYGNIIKVPRADLLAPVSALKHFTLPAFGIACVFQDVTIPEHEWIELLNDKSVHVKIGACLNGTYQVAFINTLNNRDILNALRVARSETSSVITTRSPPLPQHSGSERKRENGSVYSEKQLGHLNDGRRPPMNLRDEEDSGRSRKGGGAPSGNWRKPVPTNNKIAGDAKSDREEPSWGQLRTRNDRNEDSNRMKVNGRAIENRPTPKPAAPPVVIDSSSLTYPQQPGLKHGQTLEIVYIRNPEDFHCQLSAAIASLDDLMSRLAIVYENGAKPSIPNAKVGMPCVALYAEDGGWYRGRVTSVEGATIEVRFVDYGNKQKSTIDQVKIIDKQFLSLPPQAYHCCLTGIEKKNWTEEDELNMESATITKSLRASYVRRSKAGRYQVVLMDEGRVVNEMFGYPESVNVPAPETGYTWLPLPSEKVDVNVSWYFHSAKFFLSPVNRNNFELEMEQLEEFYSSLDKTVLQEVDARVGMPCVTRFSEDQRFYRAEIIAIRGQTAEVLYVDYGNEEEAPLGELKRIVPRFSRFPRLAWSCLLKGVEPVAPLRADSHLHEAVCFLTGKPVTAVLHAPESNGMYPVEIDEPKIGDVAQYLTKVQVVKPIEDYHLVLPSQLLNFNQGEIISNEAFVSFTKSTKTFWIQPNPEEVDVIMSRIELHTTDPALPDERISDKFLTKGTTCLALYPDDSQWYRAVIESNGEDNIFVNYIDYGNSGSVGPSQLRKLPAELAESPAMALKCRLDGVADDVDYTEIFTNLVVGIQFTVEYVGLSNDISTVRLYTSDGANLSESLQSLNEMTQVGKQSVETFTEDVTSEESTTTPVFDSITYDEDTCRVPAYEEEKEELQTVEKSDISVLTSTALIQRIDGIELRSPLTPPTDDEQDYFNSNGVLLASSSIGLESFVPTNVETTPSCDSLIESSVTDNEVYYNGSANEDISMNSISMAESHLEAVLVEFLPSIAASVFPIKEDFSSSIELVDLAETCALAAEDCGEPKREERGSQDEIVPVGGMNVNFAIPPFKTSYAADEIISCGAVLSHFVSIEEFWIQSEPKMVEEIMTDVNARIQTAKLHSPLHLISPGESCLAFHSESERWYRAVIRLVEADDIVVDYVDYGNWAAVKEEQIVPLPVEVAVYPAMASKCSLAGVESAGSISAFPFLQVVYSKRLVVKFSELKNGCLSVFLYDTNGANLNDQMQFATNLRPAAPTILDDSFTDEYLLTKGMNESSQGMGQGALAYPQQERKFTDGEVISSSARLISPLSPTEFWIQPNPDLVKEIDECIERLDLDEEEQNILWTNGDACIARDHELEISFRALVTSIKGSGVEVFCVDYGYSLTMDKSQLRRIPCDLVAYPVQALKCSLLGFDSNCTAVVQNHFFKMMTIDNASSEIHVAEYVRDEGDRVVVQLVDAQGFDVGQRLHKIVSSSTELEECSSSQKSGCTTEDLENITEPNAVEEGVDQNYPDAMQEEIEGYIAAKADESDLELATNSIGRLELGENELLETNDSTSPSKSIEFFISHFISPRHFWIQLKNRIEDLEIFEQHIAKLGLDHVTHKKYIDEELNLVHHPRRQMWCRARIECVTDGILCHFVDYGDRCEVALDDIVPCPDSLRKVAPFAQECRIVEEDFDLFEGSSGLAESLGSTILCRGTLGVFIDGVQEVLSISVLDVDQFCADDEDALLVSRVTYLESSSEATVCDLSSNLVIIPEGDEGTD